MTKEDLEAMIAATPQPRLLVVATHLPSGAIETQVNTSHFFEKLEYILESYDDDLRKKDAPMVQIGGLILI